MEILGIEDAVKYCKVTAEGGKEMSNEEDGRVLTTQEACAYLRISRPTYQKYLLSGRIRGIKAGRGWKVLKSELDGFLKGGNSLNHSEPGIVAYLRCGPQG